MQICQVGRQGWRYRVAGITFLVGRLFRLRKRPRTEQGASKLERLSRRGNSATASGKQQPEREGIH